MNLIINDNIRLMCLIKRHLEKGETVSAENWTNTEYHDELHDREVWDIDQFATPEILIGAMVLYREQFICFMIVIEESLLIWNDESGWECDEFDPDSKHDLSYFIKENLVYTRRQIERAAGRAARRT